jgi:hypothetical protein
MNNRGSFLTLIALFAALTPMLHADRGRIALAMRDAATRVQKEETAANAKDMKKRAAAAAAAVRTIARLQNASGARYFSDDVKINEAQREFALSVGTVGFIRATEKDIIVCRYDFIDGRSSLTKYEKKKKEDGIGYTLRPVKTEQYIYTFDLTAFSKRKGMNARNSLPLSEMTARLMRATTNQSELDSGALTTLYKNCVPTWVQADSAETMTDMLDNLREDLMEEAIDPSKTDLLVKPVVVVHIEDDLLLDSFSDDEWQQLNDTYNVATFQNTELRKFFVDARESLASARTNSNNSFDLNPSLAEKMFAEVEKASGSFSVHSIIISTVKEIISSAKYWGVPAILVAIFWALPDGWRWSKLRARFFPEYNARVLVSDAAAAAREATRSQRLNTAAAAYNAATGTPDEIAAARTVAVHSFMQATY